MQASFRRNRDLRDLLHPPVAPGAGVWTFSGALWTSFVANFVANFVERVSRAGKGVLTHESLDVYQTGLEFMRWFVCFPGGTELSGRLCRDVDKSATSVVLKVAEGNGRYSELDHRRFLKIAAASAVKAAAYLDLYQQQALPARVEIAQGRELLGRISAMLNRF